WLTGGDRLRGYLASQGITEGFISHAHNGLIESMTTLGVFGTLAWLALIAVIFWNLWKGARTSSSLYGGVYASLAKGLFTAWFVFQLNGLTQVNFWEGKSLHQIAVIVSLSLLILVSDARGERV